MNNRKLDNIKLHGIRNRERYFNGNRWYLERLIRTTAQGNPIVIPQEVLDKMQTAADEISLIRDASTFEEVSNINIDFE